MTADLDPDRERNRLRWRCRRGTQELDILLMRFFDRHYDDLTTKEQATFVTLLAEQDPELQQWLLGQVVPDDAELSDIVHRIRNTPAH